MKKSWNKNYKNNYLRSLVLCASYVCIKFCLLCPCSWTQWRIVLVSGLSGTWMGHRPVSSGAELQLARQQAPHHVTVNPGTTQNLLRSSGSQPIARCSWPHQISTQQLYLLSYSRNFCSWFRDTWKRASPSGKDKSPRPSCILWLCILSHKSQQVPFQREAIWTITSQTDAANLALPKVIIWNDVQTRVVFLDIEITTLWGKCTNCFPPRMSLMQSKNSIPKWALIFWQGSGWGQKTGKGLVCCQEDGEIDASNRAECCCKGREIGTGVLFLLLFKFIVCIFGACEMLWVKNLFDK